MLTKTFWTITAQMNNEYANGGRNYIDRVSAEHPECGFIPMPKNIFAAMSTPYLGLHRN